MKVVKLVKINNKSGITGHLNYGGESNVIPIREIIADYIIYSLERIHIHGYG